MIYLPAYRSGFYPWWVAHLPFSTVCSLVLDMCAILFGLPLGPELPVALWDFLTLLGVFESFPFEI